MFLFLTKHKERTQIRLADFIVEVGIHLPGEELERESFFDGYTIFGHTARRKYYFDNNLKNYPISEGDLINIRTEKDILEENFVVSFFFTFLLELDPL